MNFMAKPIETSLMRPSGTRPILELGPGNELPGYFQASLRDDGSVARASLGNEAATPSGSGSRFGFSGGVARGLAQPPANELSSLRDGGGVARALLMKKAAAD
jgi:hypothetical protein